VVRGASRPPISSFFTTKKNYQKRRITSAQRRCGHSTRLDEPRWGNARHRLKHAAKLLPQGRQRPTPRFCAAGAGCAAALETCASAAKSYGQRLELFAGTSPRGLPCKCTEKTGNIYSVPLGMPPHACSRQGHRRPTPSIHATGECYSAPLYIYRVFLLLLSAYLQQSRRRPTPRFCAAGAGGITTVEARLSAAAKVRPTNRARRKYYVVINKPPFYVSFL
jgi:hypothetical protein